MNTNIISDYRQLKDCPRLVQFYVVFTNVNDRKEEYVFLGFSLSACVERCMALINYMFQIKGMDYVYIFPANSTLSFRNIYSRQIGMGGKYKLIQCQSNYQLTFDKVRAAFLNS